MMASAPPAPYGRGTSPTAPEARGVGGLRRPAAWPQVADAVIAAQNPGPLPPERADPSAFLRTRFPVTMKPWGGRLVAYRPGWWDGHVHPTQSGQSGPRMQGHWSVCGVRRREQSGERGVRRGGESHTLLFHPRAWLHPCGLRQPASAGGACTVASAVESHHTLGARLGDHRALSGTDYPRRNALRLVPTRSNAGIPPTTPEERHTAAV
jgi:hypothetical protein